MNIEAPKNAVYPLDDEIGFVGLIQSVGDDSGIVNSARVSLGKKTDYIKEYEEDYEVDLYEDGTPSRSYSSIQKLKRKYLEDKDLKLIRYLLEHHHGTPLEHNSLTFLVKCPIFIARQWMRHRISSFNEISGRYVEVKDEFYIPSKFRKQSASNRQASVNEGLEAAFEEHSQVVYKKSMEDAFRHYIQLLEAGVCREQARAVLPLATYTEFYWTCNLRSFLHFIELRIHEGAQFEIRCYALAMVEQVKEIFPETIQIWQEIKALTIPKIK